MSLSLSLSLSLWLVCGFVCAKNVSLGVQFFQFRSWQEMSLGVFIAHFLLCIPSFCRNWINSSICHNITLQVWVVICGRDTSGHWVLSSRHYRSEAMMWPNCTSKSARLWSWPFFRLCHFLCIITTHIWAKMIKGAHVLSSWVWMCWSTKSANHGSWRLVVFHPVPKIYTKNLSLGILIPHWCQSSKQFHIGRSTETCQEADDPGLSISIQECFVATTQAYVCMYVWVLYISQVNHSPSFSIDTPLDLKVKEALITDTLKLVGVSPSYVPCLRLQVKPLRIHSLCMDISSMLRGKSLFLSFFSYLCTIYLSPCFVIVSTGKA